MYARIYAFRTLLSTIHKMVHFVKKTVPFCYNGSMQNRTGPPFC